MKNHYDLATCGGNTPRPSSSPLEWSRVTLALSDILRDAAPPELPKENPPLVPRCPIVSFEGVCGSGKTTQITKCRDALEADGYKVTAAELPSHGVTPTALLLNALNRDPNWFDAVEQDLPWLNPALITLDYLEYTRTIADSTDVVLFSRGLLSTYIYNYPAISRVLANHAETVRWLDRLLCKFPVPSLILYFALPLREASRRIAARSAGTLRRREAMPGLEETAVCYERLLESERFREVPVLRVDATLPVEAVHEHVLSVIKHLIRRNIST